jgi:L-alanine-DL-glutamate epimerase-like enolase superfamily enzyme
MSKSYKIDKIKMYCGRIPVRLVFSWGKEDHFPFLIIRLSNGEVEGLGEVVVPVNDFLIGLLPTLVGKDARRLDALLPRTTNDHDRILCEAISMALYDLVSRASDLPFYALLGGIANNRVPLMPCIFPSDAEEARARANDFFSQGYQSLKTKLLGDLEKDRACIEAIRAVAPSEVLLQGDANCGYKELSEASRAVEDLGAAGLDVFEDPLDGDADDYCRLRDGLAGRGAKVMVDALARRTEDLIAVLRNGSADIIGIHPDQPGSISRVMQHVQLAEAFGVPAVIGGTGYTGIGTAAYQHITAAATPGGRCGELGGAIDHGMPRSLVRQTLPMENGFVLLPDQPGLGVELDEASLAHFETDRKEW